MLACELGDDYFALVGRQLNRLNFRDGVLVSAGLGRGLRGQDYTLRRPLEPEGNWFSRVLKRLIDWALSQGLFRRRRPDAYTIYLAPRDEAGARAMSELRDRGVAIAADALAKSVEHIDSFFRMLQTELAFYVGCLNLHERLLALRAPFTFPPLEAGVASFRGQGSLRRLSRVQHEQAPCRQRDRGRRKMPDHRDGRQSGRQDHVSRKRRPRATDVAKRHVCAGREPSSLNVVDGLFTHFKREEDATMKSGKFDEELSRMNDIVDALTPNALILFNESFAATNEREGSEIARQIVSALLERPHKVVFVSHQYAFTHGFYERRLSTALFLRADRQPDGRRTFKLVEGEPLSTSFGEDVYREVFGSEMKRPLRPDLQSAAPSSAGLQ